MGHRIIIIDSETPQTPSAATADVHNPEYRVRVEYRPSDAMTPAQIGNEVTRIQRRVDKIIDGTAD